MLLFIYIVNNIALLYLIYYREVYLIKDNKLKYIEKKYKGFLIKNEIIINLVIILLIIIFLLIIKSL